MKKKVNVFGSRVDVTKKREKNRRKEEEDETKEEEEDDRRRKGREVWSGERGKMSVLKNMEKNKEEQAENAGEGEMKIRKLEVLGMVKRGWF